MPTKHHRAHSLSLAAAAAVALTLAPLTALADADEPPRELPAAALGAFSGPMPPAPPADMTQTARIGLLVNASDPARIVALLRALGLRADLDTSDPTPAIISAAEGANFVIFFYGCTNGQNCRAIQFMAGFQLNTAPTLERINEWNARRIVGQAFLTGDGAARIAHYVALRDGMAEANFAFTVEQWRIALRDYMTHIGFR
jgi:hypothetical protein